MATRSGSCFTNAKVLCLLGRKRPGGREAQTGDEGATWEGMLTVQEQHGGWPLMSGWELLWAMSWALEVTSMGESPQSNTQGSLGECGQLPLPSTVLLNANLLSYIQ